MYLELLITIWSECWERLNIGDIILANQHQHIQVTIQLPPPKLQLILIDLSVLCKRCRCFSIRGNWEKVWKDVWEKALSFIYLNFFRTFSIPSPHSSNEGEYSKVMFTVNTDWWWLLAWCRQMWRLANADLRVVTACPPLLRYSIAPLPHLQSPVYPRVVVIHAWATDIICRNYSVLVQLHSFKLVHKEDN